MKLLLTSAGIKNPSIQNALIELIGKPTADCDALCIPTAFYGHPWAGPRQAWKCISGNEPGTPTGALGWKSMGVLELTALPSLDAEQWVPLVRETDVLLAEGGDAAYLCHWMRESGLADLLLELRDTVWVGVSVSHTSRTPTCRRTPWPPRSAGRPISRRLPMRSTTPPFRSSTAPSRSSRKASGSGSARNRRAARTRLPAVLPRHEPTRA